MSDRVFRTSDLGLASALHASNRLPLVAVEKVSDRQVEFLFDDSEGLSDIASLDYGRGKFYVDAHALFASQKFLRRRTNEVLGRRVY